jgi:hypothetical protein
MQVNGQLHALSAGNPGEESPVPIGVGRFVKENNLLPPSTMDSCILGRPVHS